MKSSGTSIKLKRTKNEYSNFLTGSPTDNTSVELPFGAPLFIDNEADSSIATDGCKAYLVIGSGLTPSSVNDPLKVKDGRVFKGFINKAKADSIAFIDGDGNVTDEDNNTVSVDRLTTTSIDTPSTTDTNKYHILVQNLDDTDKKVNTFKLGDNGIYITGNGVMHGAAWNDFAEYRCAMLDYAPGTVVCDVEDGQVAKSHERMQVCPYVVSDTYGIVIGDKKGNIPVAVAGRVLVEVDCDVAIGDCLCAGENGKATKMTRLEMVNYPDRILGIVSEIPNYSEWNGVEVKGRVWVRVR